MPVEVLERAKWELVNWHGAGMSVMEMSHRGKEFVAIAAEAEAARSRPATRCSSCRAAPRCTSPACR
jgi:hypothetical protein